MKNKKPILKFITIFLISFLIMEGIEHILKYFFNFDIHMWKYGWISAIIIYGFKYHILCCLLPAIWAAYKCRHKKCEHDYCESHK